MKAMKDIETWSVQKSNALFGFENWGGEYFGINNAGHATVSPNGANGPTLDLFDLVQSVRDRGIEVPVLFRFNGILRHRVRSIYQAFQNAIAEHNYQGKFRPAYPIKVNQQRHVVEALRQAGRDIALSLEVGSKPELMAVLAIHDNSEGLLLCNGYKDDEYIELALLSQKVGRHPIIIIEKHSELQTTLDIAKRLGVQPQIGFRLRLAGKGAGRWERSGGERAKFGLTIAEVVSCMDQLESAGALASLRLLHFHIGSQLTAIGSLRSALKEATQVYVQLRRRCPQLDHMDIGGGLAVDYDGSRTSFASSMNYTIEEYARDVVWTIDDICQQGKVPHPNIVTESGRATVAHHSVLVFNALGIANTFSPTCNAKDIAAGEHHATVKTMAQLLLELNPKNCQETLHDAVELRSDMLEQFSMGLLSIEDRAIGDQCYWALLTALSRVASELRYIPEDLERLPGMLTDTYFCNLSVFQSLPDNWAIDQIFPIAPIHRLTEEPTRSVVIADITCDSDGLIESYADLKDVKRSLPAHVLRPGEPYYFAAFLVGAYQEILGDLHNLFGDTNAIHVDVDENGRIEFSNVVRGDTVREVLKYVQYDKDDLCERWRTAVENAVWQGTITPSESAEIVRKYTAAFEGYTYLSSAVA